MTDVNVTQADWTLAEAIVSAANLVTNDGYYEVDIDAAALTVARHRLSAQTPEPATQQPRADVVEATAVRLRSLVEWLEEDADNLHLLPPPLVDQLRAALGAKP